MQVAAWVAPLYAIGVLSAAVYHFANGLWTMGITWGVWTGPRAQAWATVFCVGIGLVLAGFGSAAIYGFWSIRFRFHDDRVKDISWQNHR